MYHLRLKKALSYYSGKVKATAKNPDIFIEDKETVDKVLGTGFFELLTKEEVQKEPEPEAESHPDYEGLEKLTKAELVKFAKENEIDIAGCKNRADILTEISHHYGGSYTMMELQQEA